jgi:hypothetical protein
MELFHHFSLRVASESAAREFSDIGIELERGPQHTYGSSVASIDIGERDERWMAVREIAEKYKITEFVTTKSWDFWQHHTIFLRIARNAVQAFARLIR